MKKTTKTDEPEQQETAEAAQERAEACAKKIDAILREHRCRIVPYIDKAEPVGQDGQRIMLSAAYGIIPMA